MLAFNKNLITFVLETLNNIKMAYLDTLKELEKDLFNLHPENERLYNIIEGMRYMIALKEKPSTNSSITKVIKLVFDRNLPATEQILFAMNYIGRVAKASEIVAAIKDFDSSFDKGVSTPFYKLKESGIINTYNPTITEENPTGSNHQVYYGLNEWFEKENKPFELYMPLAA